MRQERQTKEEWKYTVAAKQSSGLKATEYCAKHNMQCEIHALARTERLGLYF